jgi:hypothetical protein
MKCKREIIMIAKLSFLRFWADLDVLFPLHAKVGAGEPPVLLYAYMYVCMYVLLDVGFARTWTVRHA